jgi:hypothetical protein
MRGSRSDGVGLSLEVNMSKRTLSPYIANSNRLADVIAAIQVMGEYAYHMSRFEKWAERISGDASKGEYWKQVFEQHPEFFRLDTTRQMASLVWRRQKAKSYDPESRVVLSTEQLLARPDGAPLSRPPLEASDIKALIEAAIALHANEVELQRYRKWWAPLAASALGALIGALAGAIFVPRSEANLLPIDRTLHSEPTSRAKAPNPPPTSDGKPVKRAERGN